MRIGVIGLGYVGLVSAVGYASLGHQVWGYDSDEEKLSKLLAGQATIHEQGLVELLQSTSQKNLIFCSSLKTILTECEFIFIAVGTPSAADNSVDLSFFYKVIEDVASQLNKDATIVIKSTVPAGVHKRSQQLVQEIISAANKCISIKFISCPEFLRQGTAINDFLHPERIVVGVDDETKASAAFKRFKVLCADFNVKQDNFIIVSPASAALCKYASNAFLATRLSFINQVAIIASNTGADIDEVVRAISADSRIGNSYFKTGIGYGGSCLPKDVAGLLHIAREHGAPTDFFEAVALANDQANDNFFKQICMFFDGQLTSKNIFIWGMTFKGQTDDLRESPAIKLVDKLLQAGASVSVHDPKGIPALKKRYTNTLQYVTNKYDALDHCDALCLAADWLEYKKLDFAALAAKLGNKPFFDGRNFYEPHLMKSYGFNYFSIGR